MNGHPRIVPWKFSSELQTLKSQFFPSEQDQSTKSSTEIIANKQKAITRTLSYQLKTNIPHSLLSTAHLTTIQLRFQNSETDELDESLQLMSTMALIRFVNGLLDPSQQSTFAIPLSLLAKKIGLPSWFVEIRHEGTHDSLPSLEMLELSVDKALQWLFDNYWGKLIMENEQEAKLDIDGEQLKKITEDFKALMKNYRRIKKLDMAKEYKQNDATETGKEYWSIVKEIRKTFQVEIFLSQIIPGGKLKFERVKQMYEPLLHYVLVNDDEEELYILELLELIFLKMYQYSKFKDYDTIKDQSMLSQAQSWCEWVVIDRVKLHNETKLTKIIEIVGKFPGEFNKTLLKKLQTQKRFVNRGMFNKIDDTIAKLSQEESNTTQEATAIEEDQTSRKRSFDIDDITNDLENLKKRLRSETVIKVDSKVQIVPFQTYKDWQPKPFGAL
ncbi:hypothetical protein WICPIJ_000350 [Wickerhamomyces pijperi]|uniref:Las1p n=1 Tax=Wickerhamomyces pijperi TaxID=599730 RepID=A0A9P8QH90_WICPI|nr:hypothetical protein WICPIJ_000350 [Wickerhamomyces pijperi]